MLICHCKAVYEREIRELVRGGAVTRSQVAIACQAGTECGGCSAAVDEIISAELPGAALLPLGPSLELARADAPR